MNLGPATISTSYSLVLNQSGGLITLGDNVAPAWHENNFMMRSGTQIVSGTKTFESTILGSINGNAATVSNGVYTSRVINAGSGLKNGGTLLNDVTIDINVGYGLNSYDDYIDIDTTEIVATTGTQTINGSKNFITLPTVNSSGVALNDNLLSTGNYLNTRLTSLSGSSILLYGNQTITGQKDFIQRPSVNGSGIALQADTLSLTNVVYTTGNQSITGVKSFDSRPTYSGYGLLTTNDSVATSVSVKNEGSVIGSATIIDFVGDGVNATFGGSTATITVSKPIDIVYTTGNQNISGNKTFNNSIIATGNIYFGTNNLISGSSNNIGGGDGNRISGTASNIGGGTVNLIKSSYCIIAGGNSNFINPGCNFSFIGGGDSNHITSGINSIIVGGHACDIRSNYSSILGGISNIINYNADASNIIGGDSNIINSTLSFIGGGSYNTIDGSYSSIVGGYSNYLAAYDYSFVGGGQYNQVYTAESSIVGGVSNTIFGDASIICGGSYNHIYNTSSAIVGGDSNEVYSSYSMLGGGYNNIINYNADYSFIAGGSSNRVYGSYSSCFGQSNIINSNFSNAIGKNITIDIQHSGCTVFSDGKNINHNSRSEHSCSLDFASGVYITLPKFIGASNQTGKFGELKVSGNYLYVCTGISNSWGRIQLSSF